MDIRNPGYEEIILPKYAGTIKINKSDKWSTFWNQIKQINDKLWDAGYFLILYFFFNS